METELIYKNIRESLEDLHRASGNVERRMHYEIILESLEMLENGRNEI